MENTPAITRRERQNAARSEQILDAATRLFAEKGFHRTTTRDIADAADMAEGTLYNYFANKDDLLFGIMQRLTKAMTFNALHIEAQPSADTREHFSALLQTYRDFQYQNATMLQALLSEILANRELRMRYYQLLLEPSIQALEQDLTKHSQLGQIHCKDIPATARVLTSIFLGLFFLDVLGDPMAHTNRAEIEKALISFGYDGLAPDK
jgi:TetR/AcrR family transcriptional regulator, fatty acid metabolism regulator protein